MYADKDEIFFVRKIYYSGVNYDEIVVANDVLVRWKNESCTLDKHVIR